MATSTTTEEQIIDPLNTVEVQKVKKDEDGKFDNFVKSLFCKVSPWPQPETTVGKWLDLQPQHEIDFSRMIGDFHHVPENADYRILGMRIKRVVGPTIEYDVCRLPKNPIRMRGFIREIVPRDYMDHVLRFCDSDDVDEQRRFLQSLEVFSMVQEKVPAADVRQHFPVLMGGGVFTKVFIKDMEDYEVQAHCVHMLNLPRPYYIMERLGPTFEELLRASFYGFFDVPTAGFLAIGAIRALRTLHSLELVHRCVTNYTFAIRVLPGGLLGPNELLNHVVLTDASFSCVYRGAKRPRSATRFIGTWKYSSPSAMDNRPQYPVDDIISVIYLFTELIHGKLPWRGIQDKEVIIKKKNEFHKTPTIMADNTDPEDPTPIDIRDLALIFESLHNSNPFRGNLDYLYCYEILHRIAEINKPPTYESFFDLKRSTKVERDFRQVFNKIKRTGSKSRSLIIKTAKSDLKSRTAKSPNSKDEKKKKDEKAKAKKTKEEKLGKSKEKLKTKEKPANTKEKMAKSKEEPRTNEKEKMAKKKEEPKKEKEKAAKSKEEKRKTVEKRSHEKTGEKTRNEKTAKNTKISAEVITFESKLEKTNEKIPKSWDNDAKTKERTKVTRELAEKSGDEGKTDKKLKTALSKPSLKKKKDEVSVKSTQHIDL